MPPLQLFDSSVLIPWLRTRHYDALVTTAFASRRFLLSTVVWMELYAGTRRRADKQDLDRMVRALTSVGRVVSPEPEDFYTAGQVVATYTRRYGQMALRDHAQDIWLTDKTQTLSFSGCFLVLKHKTRLATLSILLLRGHRWFRIRCAT